MVVLPHQLLHSNWKLDSKHKQSVLDVNQELRKLVDRDVEDKFSHGLVCCLIVIFVAWLVRSP
jgi:hypothetical protein